MASTRENKIVTPTNDEAYDLAAHLARMADAANVLIKVSSQAERDALVNAVGKAVIRTDLNGLPIERNTGTGWVGTQYAELTFSQTGIPSASVWGVGTLTNDAALTTDAGLFTTATDSFTLTQPGTYTLDLAGTFGTAGTGRSFMQLATSGGTLLKRDSTTGEDSGGVSLASYRITAATTVVCSTFITLASGTTTWAGRVRIMKVGN